MEREGGQALYASRNCRNGSDGTRMGRGTGPEEGEGGGTARGGAASCQGRRRCL